MSTTVSELGAGLVSRFDQIYRSILLTKFFVDGWGRPDYLRRLAHFFS